MPWSPGLYQAHQNTVAKPLCYRGWQAVFSALRLDGIRDQQILREIFLLCKVFLRNVLIWSSSNPTWLVAVNYQDCCIGDIAESYFTYWYQCYCSVVCLFVTFMLCAQMAEDINMSTLCLLHTRAPCLIVLKFGLHLLSQSDPSLLMWVSETFDGKLRPNG